MSNFIYLPGSAGHYLSTPHVAAMNITGDLAEAVKVALSDYTPAGSQMLLTKASTGLAQAYYMYIDTSGRLRLDWKDNGGTDRFNHSTAATGITDGATSWLAATRDGTSGVVTWLKGASFAGLASFGTPSAGNTNPIGTNTQELRFGGAWTGFAAGHFYEGRLFDGDLAGTLVAHPNADDFTIGDSDGATAVDATGKTWTIKGASALIIGAPSDLVAIAGSNQINLSWSDVAANTGYSIERSLDGVSGWSEIATPGANDTSYSDTMVTPGITYFYRIIAVFTPADSDPSDAVNANVAASGRSSRSPRYGLTRLARR